MGYVGNQTTTSYSSMDKQDITGNGGTSYTLSHAVANAQEIEVFVNNVRQEPAVAYTVTGTALTMTGNVESTDDFYVVYQGKAVGTIVPPDGSVTSAKLDTNIAISGNLDVGTIRSANGTTAATIDSSGRVFQPTKPAFRVTLGSVQSMSGSETEHVVAFVETLASQNCFIQGGITLSSGVITVPVDGVYTFNMALRVDGVGSSFLLGRLRRNSQSGDDKALYVIAGTPMSNQQFLTGSTTFKLDAGDTIDVTVYANDDSSFNVSDKSEISGHLVG